MERWHSMPVAREVKVGADWIADGRERAYLSRGLPVGTTGDTERDRRL